METSYRELKANGESIVLERQENIVVERSESKLIKRKKTVVREKFSCPPRNASTSDTHCQQDVRCKGGYVPAHNEGDGEKSKFAAYLPRKGMRHRQLSDLAHTIDREISKLKQKRDNLLRGNRRAKTKKSQQRSVAVQSDIVCQQDFSASKTNIEFTIEKYSSQHKFVCTSPRYARDEQTWCRPRMRTIGLQTNFNRSSPINHNNCSKRNTNTTKEKKSNTLLQDLKAPKNPILPISSLSFGCYDYKNCCKRSNTPVNVYHLQCDLQNPDCNCNCNCCKVCQCYNMAGNYNGVICNQKRYVERGVSPCSEYNYCCDEYVYDYPNNYHRSSKAICCQPPLAFATNCCGPCCKCTPKKSHGGRRYTDLNTDAFYHPTQCDSYDARKAKRYMSQPNRSRDDKLMKKYMLSIMKRKKKHRYSADEGKSRHHDGSAETSKTKRDKEGYAAGDDKTKGQDDSKWEKDYRQKLRKESAAKIAKLLTRESHKKKGDTGSSDSEDGSEEKTLQVTVEKKKQRIRTQTPNGCRCLSCPYGSPEPDYSTETKRALKQMHVSSYESSKPRFWADENASKTSKRRKSGKKGEGQSEDSPVKEENADIVPVDGKVGKEKKYAEYISKYKHDPDKESMPKRDISTDKAMEADDQYMQNRIKAHNENIIDSKTLPTVDVKEREYFNAENDLLGTYSRSPRPSAIVASERSGYTYGQTNTQEYMPASPVNVQSIEQTTSHKHVTQSGQAVTSSRRQEMADHDIRADLLENGSKDQASQINRNSGVPDVLISISPTSRKLSPATSERTHQQYDQASQRHPLTQQSLAYKKEQVDRAPTFARDYDSNAQQSDILSTRELCSYIYGTNDLPRASRPDSPTSSKLSPPEASERMHQKYDQASQRYPLTQQPRIYQKYQVDRTPTFAKDYDSNAQQSDILNTLESGSYIYGTNNLPGESLLGSPYSQQHSTESYERMQHKYDKPSLKQRTTLQSIEHSQSKSTYKMYEPEHLDVKQPRLQGKEMYIGYDNVYPDQAENVSPYNVQQERWNDIEQERVTGQPSSIFMSAYASESSWETLRTCTTANDVHVCVCNQRETNMASKIPEFNACQCMLEKYLNLVAEYCDNRGSIRNSRGKRFIDC